MLRINLIIFRDCDDFQRTPSLLVLLGQKVSNSALKRHGPSYPLRNVLPKLLPEPPDNMVIIADRFLAHQYSVIKILDCVSNISIHQVARRASFVELWDLRHPQRLCFFITINRVVQVAVVFKNTTHQELQHGRLVPVLDNFGVLVLQHIEVLLKSMSILCRLRWLDQRIEQINHCVKLWRCHERAEVMLGRLRFHTKRSRGGVP